MLSVYYGEDESVAPTLSPGACDSVAPTVSPGACESVVSTLFPGEGDSVTGGASLVSTPTPSSKCREALMCTST